MLKGIAASEGIGIGKVVTVSQQQITYEQRPVIGVHKELDRLHDAVDTLKEKTRQLAEEMEASVNPKEAMIIRAHETMLSDPFMISQMDELIKNDNKCAEAAAETAATALAPSPFTALCRIIEPTAVMENCSPIGTPIEAM